MICVGFNVTFCTLEASTYLETLDLVSRVLRTHDITKRVPQQEEVREPLIYVVSCTGSLTRAVFLWGGGVETKVLSSKIKFAPQVSV